jgi:hypothetical protein
MMKINIQSKMPKKVTIQKTPHPKHSAIGAAESPKTFSAKTLSLLTRPCFRNYHKILK